METSEVKNKEEGQVYEVGYLIVPAVLQEKIAAEMSVIKDGIGGEGGVFISEDFPKLRQLTYTMRKAVLGRYQKYNTAYFGWVKFEAAPEAIDTIKKVLEKNDNILRFLIIKTVRENTLISPRMLRERSDEERPIRKELKKEDIKTPISEAELDKTIEELIVE